VVLMLVVGAGLFIAILVFKMNSVKNNGFTEKDVFVKIVVSALQLNGLALYYAFDWDSSMVFLLAAQNQLTSLGTSFVNLKCMSSATESTFVPDSMIWLFFPLLMSLLVLITAFVHSYVTTQEEKTTKHLKILLKRAIDTVKGTLCLALFFIQPFLVKRATLVFSCVRLGSTGQDIYMTEDLEVQCWGGEHITYVVVFGLFLFLPYVIGLPAYVFHVLHTPKNFKKVQKIISVNSKSNILGETVDENTMEEELTNDCERESEQAEVKPFYHNYAFLFLGYKHETYFWEVCILARKALLAIIGVVMHTDPRFQGMLGLLIVFAAIVAHAHAKPYQEKYLNDFEFVSLSCTLYIFFFGMFTLDAGSSGSSFVAATGLALTVNILYILLVAYKSYLIFFKKHHEETQEPVKGAAKELGNDSDPTPVSPPLSPVSVGPKADRAVKTDQTNADKPAPKDEVTDKPESPEKKDSEAVDVAVDPMEVPGNWNVKVVKTGDKEGQVFYSNVVTKKKSWKKPECLQGLE